ncbi:hypothetical protein AB834_04445 [PVC group bacterium (ex Bugula neritina AB1)]|nr:hypothetical protein AB834_04445 [PVC group bacterium (ex Bugula neritina AB1)]
MNDFFKHAKILKTIFFMLFFVLAALSVLSFQYVQLRQVEKKYKKNMIFFDRYLKTSKKVPTNEELNLLTHKERRLEGQYLEVSKMLDSKEVSLKDSFDAVEKVFTPLEFRTLLTSQRRRFGKEDMGFSDFLKKVPKEAEIFDLKQYFIISMLLFELCAQNHIEEISKVVRLQKKNLKKAGASALTKYAMMFSLTLRMDQLYNLLYDIASFKKLIFVEGVRVETSANNNVEVLLKVASVKGFDL